MKRIITFFVAQAVCLSVFAGSNDNMLCLRGRLHLGDYTAPDGVVNPAPDYGLSYQRRFWSSTYERFKTSGIYRVKLYSYPSR